MTEENKNKEEQPVVTQLIDEAFNHKENGDIAEALDKCEQAIALDPSAVEAYNLMGMLLEEDDDLEGAIEWYQRANEVDPSFDDAFFNLTEAENELRKALRQDLFPEIGSGAVGFGATIMIVALLYFYIQKISIAYNTVALGGGGGIPITSMRGLPLFFAEILNNLIFAAGIMFGLNYLANALLLKNVKLFAVFGGVGFFIASMLITINLYSFRFFLDAFFMGPIFIQDALPGIFLGLFSGFALAKRNVVTHLLLAIVGGIGFGLISMWTYRGDFWVFSHIGASDVGYGNAATGLLLLESVTQQLSDPNNAINALVHVLLSGIGAFITGLLLGYVLSNTTDLLLPIAHDMENN